MEKPFWKMENTFQSLECGEGKMELTSFGFVVVYL